MSRKKSRNIWKKYVGVLESLEKQAVVCGHYPNLTIRRGERRREKGINVIPLLLSDL